MRIGTWNVEHAASKNKNADRLRRLREVACDVWVLTETHDDLDLGSGYHAVRTTPQAMAPPGARWVTIWSRFPIAQVLAVDDANRTTAAVLSIAGAQLLVVGTVLPWHSDKDNGVDGKNWAKQYRVIEAQGREWVRLRDGHPGVAMCVAGDLNMTLGGPHYYGTPTGRALLRDALRGAGLVCVTETERVPEGLLRQGPIDHVCASSRLGDKSRVIAAWEGDADGVRLSDHSGIAVDIDLLAASGLG